MPTLNSLYRELAATREENEVLTRSRDGWEADWRIAETNSDNYKQRVAELEVELVKSNEAAEDWRLKCMQADQNLEFGLGELQDQLDTMTKCATESEAREAELKWRLDGLEK